MSKLLIFILVFKSTGIYCLDFSTNINICDDISRLQNSFQLIQNPELDIMIVGDPYENLLEATNDCSNLNFNQIDPSFNGEKDDFIANVNLVRNEGLQLVTNNLRTQYLADPSNGTLLQEYKAGLISQGLSSSDVEEKVNQLTFEGNEILIERLAQNYIESGNDFILDRWRELSAENGKSKLEIQQAQALLEERARPALDEIAGELERRLVNADQEYIASPSRITKLNYLKILRDYDLNQEQIDLRLAAVNEVIAANTLEELSMISSMIAFKKERYDENPDYETKIKLLNEIANLSELERRMRELEINNDQFNTQVTQTRNSLQAFANSEKNRCQSPNVLNTLPPLRDQGEIGWCYAMVAADLISQKIGQNVSSTFLATGYNAMTHGIRRDRVPADHPKPNGGFTTSLREGGWVADAIGYAIENQGVCLESDFPLITDQGYAPDLMNEIESMTRLEGQSVENPCELYDRVSSFYPLLDQQQFIDLVRNAELADVNHALRIMNCIQDNRTPINFNYNNIDRKEYERSDTNLGENLLASLNEGRAVGISLRMALIGEGARYEVNANHAMVVVGTKFNEATLSCDYLVRNSWGSGSCNSIRDEIPCDQSNGVLTISEDILKRSVFETVEIK